MHIHNSHKEGAFQEITVAPLAIMAIMDGQQRIKLLDKVYRAINYR